MTTAMADSAVIGTSPAANADENGAEEHAQAILERAAKQDQGGNVAGHNTSTDTPQGTAGHRFPLGRWTLFRNPFLKKAKPATSVRTPVQGELWLDLVKPVRNDLTESDVEVVAAATPAAPAPEVPVPESRPSSISLSSSIELTANGCEESVPEPVWSRLKMQFFGAEKE